MSEGGQSKKETAFICSMCLQGRDKDGARIGSDRVKNKRGALRNIYIIMTLIREKSKLTVCPLIECSLVSSIDLLHVDVSDRFVVCKCQFRHWLLLGTLHTLSLSFYANNNNVFLILYPP